MDVFVSLQKVVKSQLDLEKYKSVFIKKSHFGSAFLLINNSAVKWFF